jgi:hypothetical protein
MLKLSDLTPGMALCNRPSIHRLLESECLWLVVAVDRENDAAWVLVFLDGKSRLHRKSADQVSWDFIYLHVFLDHEGTDITGQLSKRIRRERPALRTTDAEAK